MAVGSGASCKACKSPNRVEVDRRLLSGEPLRKVLAWLAEQGEKMALAALHNHKREHASVSEEIAERVAAVEAVHKEAVAEGVNRVQLLQRNADVMIGLRDLAAGAIRIRMAEGYAPQNSLVALVTGAAAEVRQSIQAVQKALGEEPPAGDDRDARAELDSLLSELAARRDEAELPQEAEPTSG